MLTPNRPQKRLDYIAKQFGRTPRAVAYAMNAAAWLFDMEAQARYRRARERIFEAEPGSEEFWEAYRAAVALFPAKGENDDIIVWFARELAKAEKAGDNDALESLADRLGRNAAAIALWREAERPDLMSMSVSDVEEALGEFDAARGARPPQGAVVLAFDDGWTWQELEPSMLKCEGQHMHHCVGGFDYKHKVADGRSRILSLRDENGYPHATVEIVQNQGKPAVSQVFGPYDEPLPADSREHGAAAALFEKLYLDDELYDLDQALGALEKGVVEQYELADVLRERGLVEDDGGDVVAVYKWSRYGEIENYAAYEGELYREAAELDFSYEDAEQWLEESQLSDLRFVAELDMASFDAIDIPLRGLTVSRSVVQMGRIRSKDAREVDLSRSHFIRLDLDGEFYDCNFIKLRVDSGEADDLTIDASDLSDARLTMSFSELALSSCDLRGAVLNLEQERRPGLNLSDSNMSGCELSVRREDGLPPDVYLEHCDLSNAQIGSREHDTDISDFSFVDCTFDDSTHLVRCRADGESPVPGWVTGADGYLVRE